MSMIKVKVGEILALSLQAFDGEDDLHPQAIVKDTSGNTLTVLDLSHVGNGLYINRSYMMPDFTILTSQYKTYEDSGHTVLSENYQDQLDIFIKEEMASSLMLSDGTIFGVIDDEGQLVGYVDEVSTSELSGYVSDEDEIVGYVEDEELIGYISDDSLVGIIEEC